jgi:hypothetical protein
MTWFVPQCTLPVGCFLTLPGWCTVSVLSKTPYPCRQDTWRLTGRLPKSTAVAVEGVLVELNAMKGSFCSGGLKLCPSHAMVS